MVLLWLTRASDNGKHPSAGVINPRIALVVLILDYSGAFGASREVSGAHLLPSESVLFAFNCSPFIPPPPQETLRQWCTLYVTWERCTVKYTPVMAQGRCEKGGQDGESNNEGRDGAERCSSSSGEDVGAPSPQNQQPFLN